MSSAKARVLVIEDDASFVLLATHLLENAGYEVFVAGDGVEGLKKAQELRPNLILLDVQMPHLDGWEVIQRLRSSSDFATTPVIFLSGGSDAEDHLRGFHLGADDYVHKDAVMTDLTARVGAALNRSQRLRDAFQPPAAPADSSGTTHPITLNGSLDQIGIASLLTLLDLEKQRGALILTAVDGGERACIFVQDGRVASAQIESSEEIRNLDVVRLVLDWDAGKFVFHPSEDGVVLPEELGLTITQTLMSAAHLSDEEKRESP